MSGNGSNGSNWETVTVQGAPMRTFVARPAAPVAAPGILVVQHAPGVDRFVQEMTARLAAAGYVAAAPDLYHRQHPAPAAPLARMARLRDGEIIDDCNAVLDHLAARRLGIVGFCMGGRVAYLMAAASDRLQAAVAFYGGNTRVAWGAGAAPFDRLRAVGCPVLGLFGGRDENPSPEDRDAIDGELTRHGVPHTFHTFAAAGHGYMDFSNPQRHDPAAAAASWPLTLEFLQRYLK